MSTVNGKCLTAIVGVKIGTEDGSRISLEIGAATPKTTGGASSQGTR